MFGLGEVTCGGCGFRYGKRKPACPACLVPQGQTRLAPVAAGGPAVHVRVYAGRAGWQLARYFQQDAARIARQGWRPTSQSTSHLTLTVTYERRDDDDGNQ